MRGIVLCQMHDEVETSNLAHPYSVTATRQIAREPSHRPALILPEHVLRLACVNEQLISEEGGDGISINDDNSMHRSITIVRT
jgi:hypothetical protein